jgi:hypothetical protein
VLTESVGREISDAGGAKKDGTVWTYRRERPDRGEHRARAGVAGLSVTTLARARLGVAQCSAWILTCRVSRTKRRPITNVMRATTMGYQSP